MFSIKKFPKILHDATVRFRFEVEYTFSILWLTLEPNYFMIPIPWVFKHLLEGNLSKAYICFLLHSYEWWTQIYDTSAGICIWFISLINIHLNTLYFNVTYQQLGKFREFASGETDNTPLCIGFNVSTENGVLLHTIRLFIYISVIASDCTLQVLRRPVV
jgi:hypothetical protein